MAALWRMLGGGSGIPNFDYTFDESSPDAITLSTQTLEWKLIPGTSNNTSSGGGDKAEKVTIFMLHVPPGSSSEDMVRNAAKRAKTLRLPGVLKCYDVAEHKDTVYIATSPCVPLRHALNQKETYWEDEKDRFEEGVAFGLHSISSTLQMLHANNLVHHYVNTDTVYVLPSGEFRLFGFEFVSTFNEEHSTFRRFSNLALPHRVAPEGSTSGVVAAVHLEDSWGLAVLIFELLCAKDYRSTTQSDVKQAHMLKEMPRSLTQGYQGLVAQSSKQRWTPGKFRDECAFIHASPYVEALQQLDELNLKDTTDRDAFYRKLSGNVSSFPLPACKLLILPKLNNAVQFGGSSASLLEPLLKIGTRLDPTDFAEFVSPSVVSLFASQEHLIRFRLLTTANEYASMLPSTLVCEKIWPHYQTGFTHKSEQIRELTVRALVHFAPNLAEGKLMDTVARQLNAAQQDREGSIRTNATICLSLVAKYFPEDKRASTLLQGFGRMLKDPFTPSRAAAVKSIEAAISHFTPSMLAEQILPVLSPMMLDPESDVRTAAVKAAKAIVQRVAAHAETMPVSSSSADATPHNRTTSSSEPSSSPKPASASTSPPPQQQSADTKQAAAPNSSSGWGWGLFGRSAASSKEELDHSSSTNTQSKPAAAATSGTVSAPLSEHGDGSVDTPSVARNAKHADPTVEKPPPQKGGWDDDDDDDFGSTSTTTTSAPVVKLGGGGAGTTAASSSSSVSPRGGLGLKKGLGSGGASGGGITPTGGMSLKGVAGRKKGLGKSE